MMGFVCFLGLLESLVNFLSGSSSRFQLVEPRELVLFFKGVRSIAENVEVAIPVFLISNIDLASSGWNFVEGRDAFRSLRSAVPQASDQLFASYFMVEPPPGVFCWNENQNFHLIKFTN